MERLTIQESANEVASYDVVSCDVAHRAVCAEPLDPFCENYNGCEATVGNPLLCNFLSSLNAKEEKNFCPGSDHTYHTFTLQPGAYTKTLESLRESGSEVWEYVSDKLRYDLINDKLIVIKMATRVHEAMTGKITDSIRKQLINIAQKTSNEDTKRLIEETLPLRATSIHLHGLKTFRHPDEQFHNKSSYYPGVVIEVAYSQSFKNLRRKASDFIVKSHGEIQLVIGLEVESNKSSKTLSSKISVWRPEFFRFENRDAVGIKTVIDQDIIRDSDGTPRSGGLRFCLQDFGTKLAIKYPNADLAQEIVLGYDVLAEYLLDIEQWEDKLPSQPSSSDIMEFGYSTSSEEELTSEDEKMFGELGKSSRKRSEALDPDYSEDL